MHGIRKCRKPGNALCPAYKKKLILNTESTVTDVERSGIRLRWCMAHGACFCYGNKL